MPSSASRTTRTAATATTTSPHTESAHLDEDLLPEGWTVPLIHLLLAARETNRPAAQVYERCVALGLPVPTDETVATAMAQVPRAPGSPAVPTPGTSPAAAATPH
ncbi:wHTH domain-containing protein [Streptomyces cyaneofuscatus]